MDSNTYVQGLFGCNHNFNFMKIFFVLINISIPEDLDLDYMHRSNYPIDLNDSDKKRKNSKYPIQEESENLDKLRSVRNLSNWFPW